MYCSAVLSRLDLSTVPFIAGFIVRGFEIRRHALHQMHSLSSFLYRDSLEYKSSLSFSITNFSSMHPSNVDLYRIIDEERNCADQHDDYDMEDADGLVAMPSHVIGKEHENNIRIEDHELEGDNERPIMTGLPLTVNVSKEEGDSLDFCLSTYEDELVSGRSSYGKKNESGKKLLSNEGRSFWEEEVEDYRCKHKKKVGWQGKNVYLLKSLGQHLLTSPSVLDSIIQKAKILPTDTILEIGPGTGNLTIRLLEHARKVIAVEIDGRMVDTLQNRIHKLGLEDKLSVIKGNVLKMDLPHFDLCVSNVPYGISSPLIAKLFLKPHKSCFRNATLLLQKEFAHRLLAKPGDSDFNRLAVNVGLVASINFLMNVSKKHFVPCPKVDSSLVQIHPKAIMPDINLDEWLDFIRTCFSKRNKTLCAIFKQKKKIIELYKTSQSSRVSNKNFEYEDHESDYDTDKNNDSDDDDDLCTKNIELERQTSTAILSFREKIVRILTDGGFGEKRPSKLSIEDLLCLLNLFNKEGVFFQ